MRTELYTWKYMELGEKVVSTLKEKRHDAYLVEKKEDVLQKVKDLIPSGSKVAVGGSITLNECGILELLRNGDYEFYDRYSAKSHEESIRINRQAFETDFFLCSANAITLDGKIVQLDGTGTRVAPMIWGPKNVIIVAGMNKIASSVDTAQERIRFISPMNAKRLNIKTPCTRIGECINCESSERICVHQVIVETGVRTPGRFKIILVAQDLGL